MAELHDLIARPARHQQNLLVAAHDAVDQAHEDDDAAVVVVLTVENQRAQRRAAIALRGRDVLHNVLEHRVDIDAGFGRNLRRVLGRDADDLLDLVLDALRLGRGQVDLVDDRQDLQIVVEREIGVRECLRLDALAGVDDQHRALAGRERAADLVVEVHMARRVDQVEGIALAVGGLVVQADGAGLDRDAVLALELHIVEDLVFHNALLHRAALFNQAVGERGFAVVNVGNDRKIADSGLVCHSCFSINSFRAISARSVTPRICAKKATAASAVLTAAFGASLRHRR